MLAKFEFILFGWYDLSMTDTIAILRRITTEYDEAEDRIRLVGECNAGTPVVLWLTQRLLQRLLPVMLERLHKPVGDDVLKAVVVQEFAQQAARARMTPQAPLRPSPETESWLVRTIDVASTKQGMRLTFKGKADENVGFMLEGQSLRQWLNIVYDLYRKAGWPLAIWPVWMQKSDHAQNQQPIKH